MLRNAKVKYLVVRTHGLASHLIDPSEIRSWIFIDDDRVLFDKISQTFYGGFFEKPEDLRDPIKIEEAAMRVNFIRANKLISIARVSPLEGILRTFMSKYDLENLRRIVFSHISGRKPEKLSLLPHGSYLYDTEKLLKIERLEDLVELLDERRISSVLSSWLSSDRRSPTELDLMLTRIYVDSLLEPVKERRNSPLYKVLISYSESLIIGNLLKALYLKVEKNLVNNIFSNLPFKKILEVFALSDDLNDFLDKLVGMAPYRSVSIEVRDSLRDLGEPWVIEHSVSKRAYTEALRVSLESPMSEAYIVSYLVSSEWESQSLKTLLLGRISGASKEVLYNLLVPKEF